MSGHDAGVTDERPPIVDYLSNCFLPDRRKVWDGAIERAGIPLKVRKGDEDSFASPADMVARMDELGIETVLLSTCDIGAHGTLDPFDFEHVATRWEEMQQLATDFPGRFAALAVAKPGGGMAAVRETRRRLNEPWVVGMFTHTHSWDLRFDAAEYYPYYALASDEGVGFAMQAGTSGGLMPSECGHPIGIDRAALYFPQTHFVLSHTGYPWVDEAVAMALKFPNVFLGTGAYPPRHWHPSLTSFLRGPGKRKVVFGTNFPTVGHRHGIAQLDELGLDPPILAALVSGTAHTVFPRLATLRP
jgi:predicted TIM-barrel fold metal-dependent hydrolase